MDRERDVEKLFSENLDNILAGRDVETGLVMDDDLKSALEFARTMKEMRPAPSPEFESSLKERLLAKLAGQKHEAPKRQNWLHTLWPRRLAWQLAMVLVLVVIVGWVVWQTGFLRTPGQGPASIAVQASTSKSTYQSGENVRIEATIKNVTSAPVRIDQFPPILSLMQEESKQPVYTFRAGKGVVNLAPNETARFSLDWDQRDENGRLVPEGRYYIELEDLDLQGKAVRLSLTKPVQFDIQLPQYR